MSGIRSLLVILAVGSLFELFWEFFATIGLYIGRVAYWRFDPTGPIPSHDTLSLSDSAILTVLLVIAWQLNEIRRKPYS